jgi:lipopolysaccharide transport system ATP-binding protein
LAPGITAFEGLGLCEDKGVKQIALSVDRLSKKYCISESRKRTTLREELAHTARSFGRRLIDGPNLRIEETGPTLWALRDVSFEVQKGEVLGIIGRNGSGKSTLLKILSRITEPTAGKAIIYGRIRSLLEAGTGFHPELTGRDNVYLNGAILGMTRSEINRKFDQIVTFAEVENFLSTPVKHYSSGMYVRLAFAVAAHMNPEILLVDEVLAVGDASFQQKCIQKMNEVAEEGRTVLFVSHNLSIVNRICSRILLLDNGQVESDGPAAAVIHRYFRSFTELTSLWSNPLPVSNEKPVVLLRARILKPCGKPAATIGFCEGLHLEITYQLQSRYSDWRLMFRVIDQTGQAVFTSWDDDSTPRRDHIATGIYTVRCIVPGSLLKPGIYGVTLATATYTCSIDLHESIMAFEISAEDYPLNIGRVGVISPVLTWQLRNGD